MFSSKLSSLAMDSVTASSTGRGIPFLILLMCICAVVGIVLFIRYLIRKNISKKGTSSSTVNEKLLDLSTKYKNGEITESEYDCQRAEIIKNI